MGKERPLEALDAAPPFRSTTGDEGVVLSSDVVDRHLGIQEDAPLLRLAHHMVTAIVPLQGGSTKYSQKVRLVTTNYQVIVNRSSS